MRLPAGASRMHRKMIGANRRVRILKAFTSGATPKRIAAAEGVDVHYVWRILRELNHPASLRRRKIAV